KRIHDACREAGVKVEFYGDEYGFTVRFYRHCGEEWGKASDSKTPKHQDDALKEALGDALEIKLIAAIRKQPAVTQQELVNELAVSRATIQRLCKALSVRGVIERKGGKRYGYWEILKEFED
ncbi:MAG: MarR family transcriptional regulator, partial [Acidaminococcaceae bacterium]|nr:MarR family transcriptional regulator [Acidaminococcaceae bacterium]